jgi:type VI secretion system protein ImpK
MTADSATTAPAAQRRGHLALALQEAFTVAARLRTNRLAETDAFSFRNHVKQQLAAAHADLRGAGYTDDDVNSALYAFVAFLDESALNSAQPMFAEWHRQPLQEEVFGGHVGGEQFFQMLRGLQARQDSEDLADVLEVFQLCLLLGFHGRYAVGDQGELRGFAASVGERISRIRGGFGPLAAGATPRSGEAPPRSRDPQLRRLLVATGTSWAVVLVLFVLLSLWLSRVGAAVATAAPGAGGA